MNLRQMECFLTVCEELHFRRAADRLHLAPASVSEAVGALERSLGVQLLQRTSRRVRLTPQGEEFAAAIRQPIEDLRRAHRAARRHSASARELVIGHTPELGQLLLGRLVEASSGADALPSWRPLPMHTPQQLTALTDGAIDIGLCWSVPSRPGVESRVLGEVPLVVVLRADDPLVSRRVVPLVELRSRRILVTPRTNNPYLERQLRAGLTMAGISDSLVEEVERYDELVMHVATRGHVGLHPGAIALTSTLSTVVFRPVADADPIQVCAITRTEARPDRTAVVDAIAEIFASMTTAAGWG
ncbi:DNA-binding transcriptional LysR family regulator [Friedmanniella antarctica]|uniref:DNA-binding transcriptional LysR family regulator n=1 Tax=Microlunatus antarcticus TaxID=53388 RepID=A0A7W5JWI3_9ACTN|nr:LysR family transcriptional regulator [Microlunatus antarcticus]MBB3327077.1 DNA-binding transcriptional LysR family regulator [Microlunatus antarcticus]